MAALGVSPPDPDLLFPRGKSRQKHARREKPFRWGFSPVTPSSATTQRGAPAPLWNPPHDLPMSCPTMEAPCRIGWGRIQRGGRSPLIGRCGGWFLRGGHSRKCPPPMRPFGYFSGEGKVPRGTGPEAPRGFGRRHVSFPPARRWANLSPSVPCAGTGASKMGGVGGGSPEKRSDKE